MDDHFEFFVARIFTTPVVALFISEIQIWRVMQKTQARNMVKFAVNIMQKPAPMHFSAQFL